MTLGFSWPTNGAAKETGTPEKAEVRCKMGHVRWVDWDDRHAGRTPTDPHYGFTCCNVCPRGQDHTFYTGRFLLKGTA